MNKLEICIWFRYSKKQRQ